MARFCGTIGFSSSGEVETSPGVYEDVITERKYYGDVTKDFRKNEGGENLVGNVGLNNIFSIVADPFAFENYSFMKYIKYLGTKWWISSVEVQYPRLVISVGGRYNGPDQNETTGVSPETN